MESSGPELLIAYIDELSRGKSRINSALAAYMPSGASQGLERTILVAVVRAKTPPTVPQIGRSLGYPRQSVQHHVDTLIAEGLIRAVDNPDHKTAKRLEPTDAGKHAFERSNEAALRWAEAFASGLDLRDLETMVATMREIRRKLEMAAR